MDLAKGRTFGRSISQSITASDEIKQQLQSINQSVPYFEGLPAIDYDDHKENTWGNVFKGKAQYYTILL